MDANTSGSISSCDLNSPYTDFQGTGGTSASVQAFAGIMALVNQSHGRQGNANYVLYPMAAKSGASCTSNSSAVSKSSCTFYDVTAGNNSVICEGGTSDCSNTVSGEYGIVVSGVSAAYPATAGYDLATGLGSVNAANLVNNWTSSFTPSTTTLSLSTSPATNPVTLTHGQPVNFTIEVAAGSETPSGDVSLIAQTGSSSSNATGIGPFTLSGGSVSGTTAMLPGGTYDVTAHYAGNGTFGSSDSSPGIPVTVGKESSLTELRLVTSSSSGSSVYGVTTASYGSPYVLRMDVTNSSGQICTSSKNGSISYPCPTGNVTVTPAPTDQNPPAGAVPGSYVLNSQGYAEDQPIQQSPGTYNFVASYAGDNSYTASTSPTTPITITQAPTTTTLTNVPSTYIGDNFGAEVILSTQNSGAAPTGTMQILCNGASVGSSIVSGSAFSRTTGAFATGQAYVSTSLPAGTYSITAQYSGDSNYAGSTSAAVTITIRDFSMSVNPSTINFSAPGQSGNATITLTPLEGFTGTVNLICDGQYSQGLTCAISPSSINLSGSSAANATLTVTSTAQASFPPPSSPPGVPPAVRLPFGWPWLLAGLMALGTLASLAAARRRPAGWLFATALLVVGVWAACGGGSSGGSGGGSSPAAPVPLESISPASLTFSQQYTGTASPAQSVMVSNPATTGNTALIISSIVLGGANPGDFALTGIYTGSILPGYGFTLNVTFTPTAAGSRSASIIIADNASGSPHTVPLTGTGVATVTTISLSPSSLTFGPENSGLTTAPQSVTLTNTGNATLDISSITIGGANYYGFSQTNTCGSSVAAGANCTISVVFAPINNMSAASASLIIADDAKGTPQTVSLAGTALPPVTTPGTYSCYVMAIGGSVTHSGTLTITVQ